MRTLTSSALVEASSYLSETTTLVQEVTWEASKAKVDISEGDAGAMDAS